MKTGELIADLLRKPTALLLAIGATAAAGYGVSQINFDHVLHGTTQHEQASGASDGSTTSCPEVASDISDTGDC